MATIKDIAKRSGVAVGTVSAVLNDGKWVSPALRQRVLQAIQELQYEPSELARQLRRQRTYTIGVVVPDITNPFFPQIVRGIERSARSYGFSLILSNTDEDEGLAAQSVTVLLSRKVDGLVLIGGVVPENKLKEAQQKRRLPIVVIERDYGLPGVGSVQVDATRGAYLATSHLVKLGFWPVGLISGPLSSSSLSPATNGRKVPSEGITQWTELHSYGGVSRFEGYKLALKERGIRFDASLVRQGDFTYESGFQAMLKFLDDIPSIRAVFASNDLMAIGAIEAAKQRGLRIPEDVAVVGYDDIPEASYTSPTLTTVRLPKTQLGKAAADQLFALIAKKKGSEKVVLPTELIVRNSCGWTLSQQ